MFSGREEATCRKRKEGKKQKTLPVIQYIKIRDHIVFHYMVIVPTCKELKKKNKNAVNGKEYLFTNM